MRRENFSGATINGDYRLVQAIGEGASASVYTARTRFDSGLVAVKLFDPTVDNADVEKEAKNQARLHHPNIVPFHWHGITPLSSEGNLQQHPFIVMMHANQGSLRDRLLKGTPAIDEAVDHLVQAAGGLQHAHDKSLLHRDVKPANILLHKEPDTDQLRVMVTDFGIAVKAHTGDYAFTRQVEIGTLAYMAPEQFHGRAVKASDAYGLGVIAYELFTGQKPFVPDQVADDPDGEIDQARYYYNAHLFKQPPSFEAVQGNQMDPILAALEVPVMRTLSKKPKDRHVSVGAFAEELQSEYSRAAGEERKERTIIPLHTEPTVLDQPATVTGIDTREATLTYTEDLRPAISEEQFLAEQSQRKIAAMPEISEEEYERRVKQAKRNARPRWLQRIALSGKDAIRQLLDPEMSPEELEIRVAKLREKRARRARGENIFGWPRRQPPRTGTEDRIKLSQIGGDHAARSQRPRGETPPPSTPEAPSARPNREKKGLFGRLLSGKEKPRSANSDRIKLPPPRPKPER